VSATEFDWVDVQTVRPPLGLLALTVALILVGTLGVFLTPVDVWSSIGYAVSGIGAISAIGLYRFADARLRTQAGYRVLPSARLVCQVLLMVAWLISVADAWRLATELSR
jgi:hypothetical protein